MIEIGVNSDNEDAINPEIPQNEPNDYEKLMNVMVSQKKHKMEASSLQKVANSLVDLGHHKEKSTTTHLRRSKRVSKYAKVVDYHDGDDDDEFNPYDDGHGRDGHGRDGHGHDGGGDGGGYGDGGGDGEGTVKKMEKSNGKGKRKKVGNEFNPYDDGHGHGHVGDGDGDGGMYGEGNVKKLKSDNKGKRKKVGNGCDVMDIARFYSQEDENMSNIGASSFKVKVRKSDHPKPPSQEPLDNEANVDDDDDGDAHENDDDGDDCMNGASKEFEDEGIVKKKNNEMKKKFGNACEIMDITPIYQEENMRKSSSISKKPNEEIEDSDDNDGDDDKNDGGAINGSSKELEAADILRKRQKSNYEKKKKVVNAGEFKSRFLWKCNSKKVVAPPKVRIPESSLHFTGYCEEKIQLVFPKASEVEVKKLMDRFPKGFRGFGRAEGERALRWIAGLKEDYWKLRRSHVAYPEFREEKVEGLPFPKGFKGFNLEESKQICRVIASLEAAYSRLRDYYQSDVNEGAKVLQPSECHEASDLQPLEASCPPTTQVGGPQQQASSFTTSPVQPDVQGPPDRLPGAHTMETPGRPTTQASGPQQQPSTSAASPAHSDVPISSRFPNYMQNPPNWCPPYGMPWNPYVNYPPPSMGGYPGMPYYDAGMRPPIGNYPGMPYDAGMHSSMGNTPRMPYDAGMHPSMGNNPRMPYDASMGNTPRMPYDARMHPSMGNNPRMPYDAGMHPSMDNNPRMPSDGGMNPSVGNNPVMPYSSNNGNA